MNSLPSRPLILSEVGYLLYTSEKIADTSPLTVLELIFEREDDAWKAIFKEFYENEEDAHEGFHNASEAIMGYWRDDASMEKTGEMATR